MAEVEKKAKLTPKCELFCKLYASDREFFGNGLQSYAEAYGLDLSDKKDYGVARSASSRLLTNVDVLARIDELLELGPLNDSFVDKRLGFWITQMNDPSASIQAIKEYNKLKARITEKVENLVTADVTSNGATIGDAHSLAAAFIDYAKNVSQIPEGTGADS